MCFFASDNKIDRTLSTPSRAIKRVRNFSPVTQASRHLTRTAVCKKRTVFVLVFLSFNITAFCIENISSVSDNFVYIYISIRTRRRTPRAKNVFVVYDGFGLKLKPFPKLGFIWN